MTMDLAVLADKGKQNIRNVLKNYSFLKNIGSNSKNQTFTDEIVYRKNVSRVEKIITKDAETGEIVKITYFDYFNDKKVKSVEEYIDGIKFRETNYSLLKAVTDYDCVTGKKLKTTNFNPKNDDKKISTYDYELKTGKIVRMCVYRADGENLAFIKEISPETGLVTRCINYKINSQAISSVTKYDFLGNTSIKTTYYYNSPIRINVNDELNKQIVSDNLNRKVISDEKADRIGKLLDNLYKNKMSFCSINNS